MFMRKKKMLQLTTELSISGSSNKKNMSFLIGSLNSTESRIKAIIIHQFRTKPT